jgi:MFS family permease
MAGFFLLGLMFGSWVPRIPAVKASLHLSSGALGIELLAPALGAILAMAVAGAFVAKHGSRSVLRAAVILLAVPAGFIGASRTKVELFITLLLWGAGSGSADVAMNSQGVLIQEVMGRPMMSKFHGMFSLGGLVGGLLGSFAAGTSVSVTIQLAVTGIVVLIVGELVTLGMLTRYSDRTKRYKRFVRPDQALILLGLLGFASLVCEGAASDWSAVFLKINLGVSSGIAGLGYVAFAVAMITMRLFGDRLIKRFGGSRLICTTCLFGAAVFAVCLVISTPLSLFIGFASLGVGMACCAPVAISAAGQHVDSGPSVATVTTMSYTGFLVGPPIIGAAAAAVGLRNALYIVPTMAALCAVVAGYGHLNFAAVGANSEIT